MKVDDECASPVSNRGCSTAARPTSWLGDEIMSTKLEALKALD